MSHAATRKSAAGSVPPGISGEKSPPRWCTLRRRVALRGPRVTRDMARLGEGPEHVRATVDFGVDACVAAARTPDGKWVLVGRWGYATRTFGWEFPGGPLVRGERPEGAAGFELARTAGMRATSWRLAPGHEPFRDALDLRCAVAVGHDAHPDPDAAREDPFVPVRLATDAQMVELIGNGEIRDAATLAAWAVIAVAET